MKKTKNILVLTLTFIIIIFSAQQTSAQYNQLWIPDTLSGTTFNLNIKDTFSQIRPGQQTITGAINNSNFWGPTLIFRRGDTVHMNVKNLLNDSTTIHWHGMHLPAVMDGGPHQVIPPGTLWQPYWKVTNNAATYWYHPHLHEMTLEHITKGIGGFIIVRDSNESSLNLPRKYGVDDIPLMLTSRRYDATNQFVVQNTAYGDYMLTNGVPNAQVTLPKQYIRLRLLNVEIERGYNIGFSDNRTFYIIANDGGLLNTPVAVTRVKLLVGERVEILVNLGNDPLGSSLDLKAYNSNQAFGFPGGEPASSGQFGSLLNNIDFNLLHINVGTPTANAVAVVPSNLANNTYWTANDATVNRNLNVTGGNPGTNQPFVFDNSAFEINTINKNVNLNDIEKWTITNNNVFGHTFHIHDVEFKIVARNGVSTAVGDYESGWKDVMYVPRGENVTFVAKFDDYADAVFPFMYHCHFANHEDGGMMGQFVVNGGVAVTPTVSSLECNSAVFSSTPTANLAFSANVILPYTGGGGQAYTLGNTVASAGVTGLTAVLQPGTLNNGNGNLVYMISGTPASTGLAVFSISFGGQTCSFSLLVNSLSTYIPFGFEILPNPVKDILKVILNIGTQAYYIWIYDAIGRTVRMLPQPDLTNGIDVSNLTKGVYMIKVMNASNKQVLTRKFVKG
jgi:bilirubin oxidase